VTGLSRQRVYDSLRAGEIQSVVIGHRRFIVVQSYRDYLDRLATVERRQAAPAPQRRRESPPPAPVDIAPSAPRRRRKSQAVTEREESLPAA
jgi:hypothetical protein